MYGVSSSWDSAIRSSGPRKVQIDIYDYWVDTPSSYYLYDADLDPVMEDIPVESWSVTADRKSQIRRTASVRIVDGDILADFLSGELDARRVEFLISAGVVYADGSTELVPLGMFGIENMSWSEGDAALDLTLQDRTQHNKRRSQDGLLLTGLTFPQGVRYMVNYFFNFGSLPFSVDPSLSSDIIPNSAIYSGNFIDIADEVAAAIGAEWYFDVDGGLAVVPVPFVDPSDDINDMDWVIDAGDLGVLISAQRQITYTDLANYIRVTGGPQDSGTAGLFNTPLSVEVYDTDPTSLTYVLGPLGYMVREFSRQDINTSPELTAFATAKLNEYRGIPRSLSLEHLMNPALQPGDKVAVQYPDGTTEFHLVDSLTYSDGWSSSLTTRVQRQIV